MFGNFISRGSALFNRFGWAFLALNLPQFSQTLVSFLVAPFLEPRDLGLVALAAAVVLFFENLRDAGLPEAVLREERPSEGFLSAAALFLFAGGCFWALVLVAVGDQVAKILGDPTLKEILPVLALLLPLEGLNRIQIAHLMKQYAYRKLFFCQLLPLVFSLPLTFYLAKRGMGYWALVYGGIAAATVRTVAFLTLWHPRLRKLDGLKLRKGLLFGIHIVWQFLLGWAHVNTLRFLIGYFLGPSTLGLLSFGLGLGWRPLQFLALPILKIALPRFAELRRDPQNLRRTYSKFLKRTVSLAWIWTFLVVLSVPPLIPKIFGVQWKAAAPLVRFFAVLAAVQSFGWLTVELFKALGRPQVISKFTLLQLVFSLPLYATVIPAGLETFLKAFFCVETISSMILLLLAWRILKKGDKKGG